MSSTVTQYTVKVPLNPLDFPSTNRNVIWNSTEGKFNLSDSSGSNCTKWVYDSVTTPSGISQYQVRFNNADLTLATEIYVHKDSFDGSNDWSDYFNKLVKSLCCTLTVRIPTNENDFIVYDYDSSGSSFNNTYLTFSVSDTWAAPLVTDGDFTVSSGDTLCLDFDLFRCENLSPPGGDTGTTENVPCIDYFQYSATTLNPISGSNDPDIFNITLPGNGGDGQFTLGIPSGTVNTLSIGDTVYLYITYTNYWGDNSISINFDYNQSLLLTGWNNNSTQTTGESIVINTTQPPTFNNTDGYLVIQGTVQDLTSGLSNGLGNLSKWCLDVHDLPPAEDDICRGTYVQSIVDPNTWVTTQFSANIAVDGTPISNNTLINTLGGAGIIQNFLGEVICELPQLIFAFARYDFLGDDTSGLWSNVIPGDIIRYKFLYNTQYLSQGDFVDIHVSNIQTYGDSNLDEVYVVYGSIINSFFAPPNNCSSVFEKPNNIVCVNKVGFQQLMLLDGYNGSVSSLSSVRPLANGDVSVDNSDIKSITTLKLYEVDNASSNFNNILRTDISTVTLNYNKRKITYEVTGQTYNVGTNDVEFNLGNIVYDGFTLTGGTTGFSFTTLVVDYSIFVTFDYSTVNSPNSTSLVVSNGSSTTVTAKTAMTYDDQILLLDTDIKQIGESYQRSVNTEVTTNGTHTLQTIPSVSGNGFNFYYYVNEKSSGALRSGNVMAGTNGTVITYTDNSTPDAGGSTRDIEFTVTLSSGNVVLSAVVTNSTTWVVKIKTEILF
jgi:hypothetical protein